MKQILTKEKITQLLVGSSVFSTGGGIESSVQMKTLQQLLDAEEELQYINIDELQNNDYICTTYGMGSTNNTDVDMTKAFQAGLKKVQEITDGEIKALFPGETNIEANTFKAASMLGIPVLDADATGGRAVPLLETDNFIVKRIKTTPVVCATLDGKVEVIAKSYSPAVLEKKVRNIAKSSYLETVIVFDHISKVKVAKKALTLGTISEAIQLGSLLEETSLENPMPLFIEYLDASPLMTGTISEINLKDNPSSGFYEGYYLLEDLYGNILKVEVINENVAALYNDQLIVTCPDKTCGYNNSKNMGAHNSTIEIGDNLTMFALKAEKLWRSRRGKKIFSPKKLGLTYKTTLLPK